MHSRLWCVCWMENNSVYAHAKIYLSIQTGLHLCLTAADTCVCLCVCVGFYADFGLFLLSTPVSLSVYLCILCKVRTDLTACAFSLQILVKTESSEMNTGAVHLHTGCLLADYLCLSRHKDPH